MAVEKKPFLLRIEKSVIDAFQKWANDDLRSLNGQIDFVLRQALKQAGRLPVNHEEALDKVKQKKAKPEN